MVGTPSRVLGTVAGVPVDFYFIRHSLSCANLANYYCASAVQQKLKAFKCQDPDLAKWPFSLTPDELKELDRVEPGHDAQRAIEALHARVAALGPMDMVGSSSLLRAMETAHALFPGQPVYPLPYIGEQSLIPALSWDNLPYPVVQQRQRLAKLYGDDKWLNTRYVDHATDAQRAAASFSQFLAFFTAQVLPVLRQKVAREAKEAKEAGTEAKRAFVPLKVAIVTHSHFLESVLRKALPAVHSSYDQLRAQLCALASPRSLPVAPVSPVSPVAIAASSVAAPSGPLLTRPRLYASAAPSSLLPTTSGAPASAGYWLSDDSDDDSEGEDWDETEPDDDDFEDAKNEQDRDDEWGDPWRSAAQSPRPSSWQSSWQQRRPWPSDEYGRGYADGTGLVTESKVGATETKQNLKECGAINNNAIFLLRYRLPARDPFEPLKIEVLYAGLRRPPVYLPFFHATCDASCSALVGNCTKKQTAPTFVTAHAPSPMPFSPTVAPLRPLTAARAASPTARAPSPAPLSPTVAPLRPLTSTRPASPSVSAFSSASSPAPLAASAYYYYFY